MILLKFYKVKRKHIYTPLSLHTSASFPYVASPSVIVPEGQDQQSSFNPVKHDMPVHQIICPDYF